MLVSVARLVEKKGIEQGIRAVAAVRAMGHDVCYRVVGDGPLRSTLENLVDELSLQGHVQFLGLRTQNEVCSVLDEAHLFLAPSLTDASGNQEGVPVAIMEAMAKGLPVLSTVHSGIPELVEEGVSGFLVPEGDVEALAKKLCMLLEQPNLWPHMGRAGRKRIEAQHDIFALNDSLESKLQAVTRQLC